MSRHLEYVGSEREGGLDVSRAQKGLYVVLALWLIGVGLLLGVGVASRIPTRIPKAAPPVGERPTQFSCYEKDLIPKEADSGETIYGCRKSIPVGSL